MMMMASAAVVVEAVDAYMEALQTVAEAAVVVAAALVA